MGAEKGDQKQGQEQEIRADSVSTQPRGEEDGTTEHAKSGETEEAHPPMRVEIAGEEDDASGPSPSMLTPTRPANSPDTFLSPVASVSALSPDHTPTPTPHPRFQKSPETPMQSYHETCTEDHLGLPKPTPPPVPPSQLAYTPNRNTFVSSVRSVSDLTPFPTTPSTTLTPRSLAPQVSEMLVPSSDDTPSMEELFRCMEDGMSSPCKNWEGEGDGEGRGRIEDGACIRGMGASDLRDQDDSLIAGAGAGEGVITGDREAADRGAGAMDQNDSPITETAIGTFIGDDVSAPTADTGAGAGQDDISHSPAPDLDEEEISVSKSVTEPFASLPELDVGERGSGESGGDKECANGDGAVVPPERGGSPEIPLPRSSLLKLYERDDSPELSPSPSGILEHTGLQSEREASPETLFLRSSMTRSNLLPTHSRPSSRPSEKEKDQGNTKGKLLYQGVDGPVFDSDSDKDLNVRDRSRASTSAARTPSHPGAQAPVLKSKQKLPSQLSSASTSAFNPIPNPISVSSSCPKSKSKSFSKPPYTPIYISSRSLSPISTLSSSSMEEDQAAVGNSDDSDVLILPVKRKKFEKADGDGGKGSLKPEVTSSVIVVAKRVKSKSNGELGSKGGAAFGAGPGAEGSGSAAPAPDAPMLKKKRLQMKPKAPDGQSTAVTRVKKRKIYTVDKIEMKDAGQPETKMKQQPASGSAPQQSVAATRVRKRTVKEREMMMEPPLKRAKLLSARNESSASGVGGAVSSSKGKGKEMEQSLSPKKKGRLSKAMEIKWPPKIRVGEGRRNVSCLRML